MAIEKYKLGYCRISTDRQDVQGQKLELLKHVVPENLYEDIGVSGTVSAKKEKGSKKFMTEFRKVKYQNFIFSKCQGLEELHLNQFSFL